MKEGEEREMESKLNIPVEELIAMFGEEGQRVWEYDWTTPLSRVIDHMSKGVHRCLVTQDGNQIRNIISQSDIISFALKHLHQISDSLLQSTIQSLGMIKPQERKVGHFMRESKLVAAPKETLLVDCFRKMEREQVTAIPLLDENGFLVGTLSASDLRGINAGKLSKCLFQPASQFIKTQKKAVVASPSIKFVNLLKLIDTNHVHRVWIVDDDDKPVGVVSLSDIMNVLE